MPQLLHPLHILTLGLTRSGLDVGGDDPAPIPVPTVPVRRVTGEQDELRSGLALRQRREDPDLVDLGGRDAFGDGLEA